MARRSRRTPPSTRRCPMSGWRHVRRSWTPRLPSGSLPLRPLIARKTRSTVRTSRATRCRSGSPTRQDGPKIRAAKAELEAEARAAAEAKAKAEAEAEEKRKTEGRKKPGKPAAPPSPEPAPKAQKNFTDPESRIMKSKDGFVQAYNAQAAVDAQAQIIVAQDVTQSAVDCGQLLPMIDAVEKNLGRKPEQASADSGYCSEANLEALESRHIDGYVATGRAKDAVAGVAKSEVADEASKIATTPPQPAKAPTRVEAMRVKIKAGGHSSPYRLRKQLPEPVFGQIKQARGFRQFLMRGFEKVRAEWAIVCTAHNLLKLAQWRSLSAAVAAAA